VVQVVEAVAVVRVRVRVVLEAGQVEERKPLILTWWVITDSTNLHNFNNNLRKPL
jgi:hypothetical protein